MAPASQGELVVSNESKPKAIPRTRSTNENSPALADRPSQPKTTQKPNDTQHVLTLKNNTGNRAMLAIHVYTHILEPECK